MSSNPADDSLNVRNEVVMSEVKKQEADANSVEFKQGVEAGLNSEEATRNWKAGNELGRELKEEAATEESGS
jgi:hypothetical protein